ncbi:stage II sporulation protein D [Thomasclavelia cocleata]|jgi:stage II sporulation protein D|uniref:Stage II sporulation protein D n=1 Tax=Thomasclavelia cocleata TaxID=69824 RepID=A0A1I0FTQ8_9FIRM|nr:stage II sporulation protein D [Thomasclavelia cocleata]MCI9132148.1 stage II sporulation protein D [Thomasclavelia cocleata]MCI9631194.1 stage II sporulation protein D [Thomasclavelia cocleata]MCR1960965.1 stage II sporulation protein D [Thomasclavelia cocleata]NDO43017.1 stage II sporulation protein D [Thomasclavelia cocleata]PJN79514.1 stage II sporulation protein D [Thomasclavelia cocleata]
MREISVKLGIVILVGAIFLSMNYYQAKEETIQGKKEIKEEPVKVAVTIDNNVNYVDLDDYLLGVVAGEMPANFETEALKAQVVASRTFVYNRNLSVDNTTNSQVYLSEDKMKENWGNKYDEYYQKISTAIKETKNEVMKYQGDYISALFFSSSNGYTENVEDYFESSPLPYLRSVDSHWDLTIDPKNTRQVSFTKQELKEKFNCQDINFNIIAYKKSGRVATLSVGGKNYSGRQVREKLGLSSSCFTVEYVSNKYVFTTKGSGHGVGMSQYGAQGMALEGSNYKEILNHYYTNIEIVNN